MTYSEYQKLHEEWKRCDSIKRREEIEDAIFKTAYALLRKLNKVYAEWGKKFVEDNDYREDRGYLGLIKAELSEDGQTTVHLYYSDHWSYGGECDFEIVIPMQYLDVSKRMELREKLQAERIAELERVIQYMDAEIANISKRKVELQKELEELKS